MKRTSPSHKLIFHDPLLLVGSQGAMLACDFFPELFKAGLHDFRGCVAVDEMNRELIELSSEKSAFNGIGLGFGQKSGFPADADHSHTGLISRQGNCNVQRMSGCPSNQLFRRITPAHAVRWLKDGLSVGKKRRHPQQSGNAQSRSQAAKHAGSLGGFLVVRKARSRRGGFLLVEATISLSILTMLGIILLKLSLNVIHPRQWALQQTVSDAYMTYERAYAERYPFNDLLEDGSPWPVFPESVSTEVEIGRLPGDRPIMGRVVRTRRADTNNYPIDGGEGTVQSNPAAMKVWRIQSVLSYRIGQREYVKSRTVIRAQ